MAVGSSVVVGAAVVIADVLVVLGDVDVVVLSAAASVSVPDRDIKTPAPPAPRAAARPTRNRRLVIGAIAASYGFSIAPKVGAVVDRATPRKSVTTSTRTSACPRAGLVPSGR